jgi:hypothetical protein
MRARRADLAKKTETALRHRPARAYRGQERLCGARDCKVAHSDPVHQLVARIIRSGAKQLQDSMFQIQRCNSFSYIEFDINHLTQVKSKSIGRSREVSL